MNSKVPVSNDGLILEKHNFLKTKPLTNNGNRFNHSNSGEGVFRGYLAPGLDTKPEFNNLELTETVVKAVSTICK